MIRRINVPYNLAPHPNPRPSRYHQNDKRFCDALVQSFYRNVMDGHGSFLPLGMPRHSNEDGTTCYHYKIGAGIDEEELMKDYRVLTWFLQPQDPIIAIGGLYGTSDDQYVPILLSQDDLLNLMGDGWIDGRTSDAINRVFNMVSAHRCRIRSQDVSKLRTLVFDSQFTITSNQAYEKRQVGAYHPSITNVALSSTNQGLTDEQRLQLAQQRIYQDIGKYTTPDDHKLAIEGNLTVLLPLNDFAGGVAHWVDCSIRRNSMVAGNENIVVEALDHYDYTDPHGPDDEYYRQTLINHSAAAVQGISTWLINDVTDDNLGSLEVSTVEKIPEDSYKYADESLQQTQDQFNCHIYMRIHQLAQQQLETSQHVEVADVENGLCVPQVCTCRGRHVCKQFRLGMARVFLDMAKFSQHPMLPSYKWPNSGRENYFSSVDEYFDDETRSLEETSAVSSCSRQRACNPMCSQC